MDGGNQLLFVLNQRYDDVLIGKGKENIMGGNSVQVSKRSRNPYQAMNTQSQFNSQQTQKSKTIKHHMIKKKKKEMFAYVSPFIKQATEKALKRASAAQLLASKPIVVVNQGNISNDSIRSEE